MKKRIEWLDLLKGVTIYLVIFGHCITRMGNSTYITWINILICSFHMPMFFVLSGYTLNVKYNFKEFIGKKFVSLMLPAAFFSMLLILYNIIFHMFHHDLAVYVNTISDPTKMMNTILFTKRSLTAGYWFLPVLFSAEIGSYCLFKYIRNKVADVAITIVLFLCALYLIDNLQVALPFGIEEALIAIPFVVIGYLLKCIPSILEKMNKWYFMIGYLLIFMIGNRIEIIRKFGTMNMWNGDIHSPILYFINGLSGIFLLICIGIRIKNCNWINKIGKNSLYIYGIHYIFLEIACLYVANNNASSIVGNTAIIFLASLFILGGSITTIEIVKKIVN